MTGHSQADEALRRARTNPRTAVREGIRWTAGRLEDRFPADALTEDALRAVVRGWAVHVHDWSAETETLAQQLRAAMPPVRAGVTRDEYAAALRLALAGVTP
ncbi:hypothetical protein [Streptomyces xanthophaeus]|uniref:hypothetical protein n=1 Tax=Streptomyces xanthophaeus TaxID=67385 RepID=UPI003660B4A8